MENGSASEGCAALHPRLFIGDRYAVEAFHPRLFIGDRYAVEVLHPRLFIGDRDAVEVLHSGYSQVTATRSRCSTPGYS
jgi:hypothetical protein